MTALTKNQATRIAKRFARLYGEAAVPGLMRRFEALIGRYGIGNDQVSPPRSLWDENDVVLITYADTIRSPDATPLATLRDFLDRHAHGSVRTVHLLPFYPWSSDDGFSVIDYREVAPENGTWEDIERLGQGFSLMFDLVLNHCSRRSRWFRDFVVGIAPARNYFLPTDPTVDLSEVVRPRSLPLLTRTATRQGEQWVWTTFSEDQVDLDFQNPDVLFEFFDILFQYLTHGVRILRLDAIAFLWKRIGTSCIHLPETHEVVKIFRDLVDIVAPGTIILTETNVPHQENISYFGDGDEAHMVYNFALPPLLLHALLRNDATHLTAWAQSLPDLPTGQTFFNFTASHDGIGVRPLDGLVPSGEREWIIDQVKAKGGEVSTRSLPDGSDSPYELNITYRDALSDPEDPELGITRFLCSQALLLAFRGVPAIYIHSLLGTPNDHAGVAETGRYRSINRHAYQLDELESILAESESNQARIFARIRGWLHRRQGQPAFHPDSGMEIIDLGSSLFGFARVHPDQTILCLFNLTPTAQSIVPGNVYPALSDSSALRDILTGETFDTERPIELPPYWANWLSNV
ncbi:MAG: alpha-amylase family glycosyl hydrolase [Verrucomicrobiota bacterium]